MHTNLTILVERSCKNDILTSSETDYRLQPVEKTVGSAVFGLGDLLGVAGTVQQFFYPRSHSGAVGVICSLEHHRHSEHPLGHLLS